MEKYQPTTLAQDSEHSGHSTPTATNLQFPKEFSSDSLTGASVEPIAVSVKQFLASRLGGDDQHPAGLVMDHLSVEGSGTGVSRQCYVLMQ